MYVYINIHNQQKVFECVGQYASSAKTSCPTKVIDSLTMASTLSHTSHIAQHASPKQKSHRTLCPGTSY